LAPKPAALGEVTQNNSHYAVHSHSRSQVTTFGTNRKSVCDFLLVNNTNLHRILQRFEDILEYWSIFSPLIDGCLCLMHSFGVNSQIRNRESWPRETKHHSTVWCKAHFDI